MSVFILVLSGYLFTMFDTQLCPSWQEFENTTYAEADLETNWQDYAWNSKCDGLPSWYHLLVYTPLLIIIGKSALSLS